MVEKMQKPNNTVQLQKVANDNYAAIKSDQNKQINTIITAMDQFIENITQEMYKKINASNVTNENKLKLKNYWLLLTTQISMNALSYIITERGKIIDSIFGNDKKASEPVKKTANQDLIQARDKQGKFVSAKKQQFTTSQKNPGETKTTAPAPAPAPATK
jgi:p-aminobenzoyl-glutamate transporter AbgT